MKVAFPRAVSQTIARKALVVEKNSPALLFGAGVAGMVGSTVLACRATLKVEKVLTDAETSLNLSRAFSHPEYSEKDRKKDTTIIYVRTGAEILKLYSPSIVLTGASIAALAQSHNVLNRRNAALTAAYAALEKGFAEYRQRVVEKYGEDEDRNLRYGSQEVETVNHETGKKETHIRVADGDPSIYARFFDPLSPSWSKEPEYNLIFLKSQQNYANDLLRSRGHIFLNEVYDMLGIPRSKAGSVVGWVVIGDLRDHFVDFGIFAGDSHSVRDFVNGREGSILLDFNVDGVIWDKIDTPKEAISWQMTD